MSFDTLVSWVPVSLYVVDLGRLLDFDKCGLWRIWCTAAHALDDASVVDTCVYQLTLVSDQSSPEAGSRPSHLGVEDFCRG